jgi:hypothetical protein
MMSDGGKGSSPRPFSVDQSTFENNWELAFGKKEKKHESSSMEQESVSVLRSSKESSENEGN